MRSSIAFLMSFVLFVGSFFPHNDVEEVFKIPGLFQHYNLHKTQANGDFDFWDFLEMHYGADSQHAKKPHTGVKIPLYNHLSLGLIFIIYLPVYLRLIREAVLVVPTIEVYKNIYSYLFSLSLLQPPQSL